jgi:phosphonate transport system permease protein
VTGAVHSLPPAQLAHLLNAYAEAVAAKRRRLLVGAAVLAACIVLSGWLAEVDLATLFGKIGNFTSYIDRLFVLDTGARVWTDPQEWFWGLGKWGALLGETLLIAYVGTITGAVGAFCLCFLASRNLVRSALLRSATRRFLEFCRTVPEIVFALIFVVAFGLGPVPGVLAIAIHTLGALGKLFAEVVENIDPNPVEGVAATGSTWVEQVRFAVVPQVLSNFASYALLRFEINVRGAAVMGFVGAGGIGQDLITAIRKFYYSDVSALLLLIIATVMVIDLLTERVRHWLLGLEARS